MLWNALMLALREIRRNIMRSALTMLGIVIGVAAVIIMVTIGRGATAQVTEQITNLGTNLLMVRTGQHLGMGQRVEGKPFSQRDVDAIRNQVSSIKAVAPLATQKVLAVYGNENWSTNLTGTDNNYFIAGNWSLDSGRQFTESELRSGAAVCIIGETIRKELFTNFQAVGINLRLKKFSCEVIGILESKGESTMGSDRDDLILVPLRTFWRRVAGNQDISLIQVSAMEGASTDKVKQNIEVLLRERRRISSSEDDDFNVRDLKELAKTLTSTTQVLTTLLGAVAAVSLLVGGIGIMNIMLVSVTERTREIGIRLAIGALEREVLLQFLVEAMVLSSLGGIVGIILALSASAGLATMLNLPLVYDVWIMILAFFFSAAVGIIFGFFPARKAARMDPIEALRYE